MEEFKTSKEKVTLTVGEDIYPLEVILRTAYIFIDDYYIFLDKKDLKQIHVSITPKNQREENLDKIIGEFYNELLNQALRLTISDSTKTLRKLITTRALYSSYINEKDESKTEDESTYDLEKIANNWFEGKTDDI